MVLWIHPKISRLIHSPEGLAFIERLREASLVQSTDCWRWPGPITKDGYGIILIEWQPFTMHTVSFQIFKGFIPKGMLIMHECDFRRCWNPEHLFLGTHEDNVHDMMAKGRAAWQRKKVEDANRAQCAEVEEFHPAYGYKGEIRTFRCALPAGHEGSHFYNLMLDHEFNRRIYGPRQSERR